MINWPCTHIKATKVPINNAPSVLSREGIPGIDGMPCEGFASTEPDTANVVLAWRIITVAWQGEDEKGCQNADAVRVNKYTRVRSEQHQVQDISSSRRAICSARYLCMKPWLGISRRNVLYSLHPICADIARVMWPWSSHVADRYIMSTDDQRRRAHTPASQPVHLGVHAGTSVFLKP